MTVNVITAELYAHMQHDKDDADQDGNFLDQVDDHLGMKLVERFHVMGDTGDPPARPDYGQNNRYASATGAGTFFDGYRR